MPRGAVKAPVLAKNAASPSAHSASMSLMVPLLVAAAALCAVAIFFVYTFMRSKHAKSGKKKPPVDLDAVPETPDLKCVKLTSVVRGPEPFYVPFCIMFSYTMRKLPVLFNCIVCVRARGPYLPL